PTDRGHARGQAGHRDRLRSQPGYQQFRKPAAGDEPRVRPVGDDAGGGAGRRHRTRGAFTEARWACRLPATRQLRGLRGRRRRKPGGHSLLCRRESRPADGRGRCALGALVECVPNFSEGRRLDVISAIADAIKSAGARVIDVQADAAHNRMVVTFVAEPALAVDAAMAGAAVATERIDLRRHRGEHPRMGAIDVVPFVPFADLPMSICVDLAHDFGARLWKELHVPVYYYGEAARRTERRELEKVRRGGYEDLVGHIRDADRAPDEGPAEVNPSAGATAVGARIPLI